MLQSSFDKTKMTAIPLVLFVYTIAHFKNRLQRWSAGVAIEKLTDYGEEEWETDSDLWLEVGELVNWKIGEFYSLGEMFWEWKFGEVCVWLEMLRKYWLTVKQMEDKWENTHSILRLNQLSIRKKVPTTNWYHLAHHILNTFPLFRYYFRCVLCPNCGFKIITWTQPKSQLHW